MVENSRFEAITVDSYIPELVLSLVFMGLLGLNRSLHRRWTKEWENKQVIRDKRLSDHAKQLKDHDEQLAAIDKSLAVATNEISHVKTTTDEIRQDVKKLLPLTNGFRSSKG